MDKNLHNIDDIFNKAYQQFEEDPSDATWEKLDAMLDKKDADKYKKRFIGWKRVAVLLLFLLIGLIIHETEVIKNNKEGNGVVDKETIKDTQEAQKYIVKNIPDTKSNKKRERQSDLLKTEQQERFLTAKQDKLVIQEPETSNNIQKSKREMQTGKNKSGFRKEEQSAENNETEVTNQNNNTALINIESRKHSTESNNTIFLKKLSIVSVVIITKPQIVLLNTKAPTPKPIMLTEPLISKSAISASKNKALSHFISSHWSLTAFASNDWGQYRLENDVHENNGNTQDEKEEINKREKHESSFSSGMFGTRYFKKHIGLKSGLIYSNTAISIAPQEMYASQQSNGNVEYKFITSSGYGYVKPNFGLPPVAGDSIQSATAQHNLQSLSIPLMVSYKFDKKKFSIAPSAGVSVSFITSAKVKTEVTDALNRESVTINGLAGMRTFFAGFMGDINLQYNYNKQLSFNLLPSFKYAFTPITKNNVVKTFPYSFNIGAGITYTF